MSNRSAKLLLEVYDGLLFAQKSGMLNKLDGGYRTILVRPGLADTILQWAKGYLDRQKNLHHIKMGLQKKELEELPGKLKKAQEELDRVEGVPDNFDECLRFVQRPSSIGVRQDIDKMLIHLLNSPPCGYKK